MHVLDLKVRILLVHTHPFKKRRKIAILPIYGQIQNEGGYLLMQQNKNKTLYYQPSREKDKKITTTKKKCLYRIGFN